MGEKSNIEWTHATFNPWRGCTKVHTGCTNCYAEALGNRFGVEWGRGKKRVVASESYWRQPLKWARAAAKAGERRRVFCASLADVLDEEAPPEAQARLWELIRRTANFCPEYEEPGGGKVGMFDLRWGLDWLLLTKRPQRWELIPEDVRPLVWLGTSISDQLTWDEFWSSLSKAQGFARLFVSLEPQVGPVDMRLYCEHCGYTQRDQSIHLDHRLCKGRIPRAPDWVIVGGESGPGARPFDVGWARSLVEQCRSAGVPCFMKQLGVRPYQAIRGADETWRWRMNLQDRKGGDMKEWPEDLRVREFPP